MQNLDNFILYIRFGDLGGLLFTDSVHHAKMEWIEESRKEEADGALFQHRRMLQTGDSLYGAA